MSKLALQLIQENKKTKATTLDLGRCGMTEVPEEIGELVWLEELILSDKWSEYDFEKKQWEQKCSQNKGGANKIENLPPFLPFFVLLKKIVFGNSSVNDLSPLSTLVNLQQLYCSSTELSDLSPLSALVNLHKFDCSSTQVSDLSPLSALVNLQQLNCASTQVSDLSPLSALVNLQQLNCASTQVSDLSPLSALVNLQQLYCSSIEISDLSPLSTLINLQLLNCSSTKLSDLSPLSTLINLQQLYCSSTELRDLSPLSALVNLQQLSCSSTKISDLSPLGALVNLQQLYCSYTKINDLILLSALVNLRKFECRNTRVTSLSPLRALVNLQQLDCSSTLVSDLSQLNALVNLQKFDCSSTQVRDLSPLSAFVNLQKFDCSSTQVSDLNPLSAFVNLQKFDCSSTKVSDLNPLSALVNLQKFDCSSTKVSDLSPILSLIKNGRQVKLKDFDGDIRVKNCPLVNPPIEIVQQGNEAILRYFEEIERLEKSPSRQGVFIKVREAKVLLVGQGKSGKTTLRKKLENPDSIMPAPGDTTRGIEITRLDERMPHSGEPLRLNIWDFGGQDIQHYAHQFFLTGSSLYALVTNERIQDSVHLPYWLNIIEMLGKKSPIILIQNKDGGNCQALKDEAAIRARFANVHNRVFQSDFSEAKTEEEFAALRKKIVELASELPHIEKEYLISFNRLREKLEAQTYSEKHYLRWDDYLKLMTELGEELMRDYANALTFLGVCQYFPDDAMLSEYVFLRPKWLIDALFELLLHPSLGPSRGHFSENDTRKIWKQEEYRGMHSLLVRMMKKFELCYRVDGEGENYIVPQRLPGENITYGWNPKGDVPVQFKFKFMPKGILTRLICRLHPRIENDPQHGQRVWNDAVIFTLPNGKGKVFAREVYSENIIELRATGEKHSEMLNEVIRKMDDINRDAKYDNLQVEKLVPCPCAECAAAENPGFHEFDALQKRIEKGKNTSECKKSGEDVLIDEIFGKSGVKKPRKRREVNWSVLLRRPTDGNVGELEEENHPLKIFVSYSKLDLQYKDTLLKHLSGLRDKIVTWHDHDILPGEDWDKHIKSALSEADVVLYLVSANSIATEYIQNVELPLIEARCDAGDCILVPVIVDFCVWTELDFAKKNALPEKGIPITDEKWKNENQAWVKVVEGMQQILAQRRAND